MEQEVWRIAASGGTKINIESKTKNAAKMKAARTAGMASMAPRD